MTDATDETNLVGYLVKPPTAYQWRFYCWLKNQLLVDPNACETKDEAFFLGVRLAIALRTTHQASDDNQSSGREVGRPRTRRRNQ